MAGTDIYEAHITVDCGDIKREKAFGALSNSLGAKAIYIRLPFGENAAQVMSASFHRGEFGAVRDQTRALAEEYARRGFCVKRTKIEAMILANTSVPLTDEDAKERKSYFEYHVKVANPDSLLERWCGEHHAHLSMSTSSKGDGLPKRFVTMRYYGMGKQRAETEFNNTITALRAQGYELTNLLREYVVFDDNPDLDAEWGSPIAFCSQNCKCPFMELLPPTKS